MSLDRKKSILIALTGLLVALLCVNCDLGKPKSDIEINFVQDTLDVGYTYWWSQNAPFNGTCDDIHSLVLSGTIIQIDAPNDNPGPLYTSQEGIIEIAHLYKIQDPEEQAYANQKYLSTDCFFESELTVGDTVLVFCSEYENNFSIPGKECIIKISGFDDPLIKSIRKYIDANDNLMVLKNDIGLWATHNLGRKLEASIACNQEMNNNHDHRPELE